MALSLSKIYHIFAFVRGMDMKKKICFLIVAIVCFLESCNHSTEHLGNDNSIIICHIQADYPEYESTEDIYEVSDLIISGTIINQRYENLNILTDNGKESDTGLKESSEIPYTIYEIRISEIFKGECVEDTIYVKCPGGTINGVKYVSSITENLAEEKEYLFLLKTFDDSYPSLINDTQSYYDMNELDNVIRDRILELCK